MGNKKFYIMGFVIAGLIVSILSFYIFDVYKNRESYKEDLVRFHVIANSDSPIDQALKLEVRDRVLKEMYTKFDARDISEAKSIIKDNLTYIEKIANDEVKKHGFNYPVKAVLGKSTFPTKSYGSIALPAGTYNALKVVIGSGQGKNWWCVLFPPLCFIDVKHGLTDQKTQQELKQVMTEDEFNMISAAAANEGELPIKLKFKVVEILEKSKWKISKLVGYKN
ncbi:MAG: stage sporulation protein [Candidatus Petromonas sp.]|jgi:stage II sporulation protein R|nr:stage sporulation protein [Candidatus Petromonas sp.]